LTRLQSNKMQIVAIVEPPFSWEAVAGKLRRAGFHERLDLFVQPGVEITETPQESDNVLIRRLPTRYSHTALFRNILNWWYLDRGGERFLCVFDGSLELSTKSAEMLRLATSADIQWGLLSLYLPENLGQYFTDAAAGWNSFVIPVPTIACCVSDSAVETLMRDEMFWQSPDNEFHKAVFEVIAQRSLTRAVHYPSLSTTTITSCAKSRGLQYHPHSEYSESRDVDYVSLSHDQLPDADATRPGGNGQSGHSGLPETGLAQ
jgi:hypothetical protein